MPAPPALRRKIFDYKLLHSFAVELSRLACRWRHVCVFTQIYESDSALTSLVYGQDGNLYLTDASEDFNRDPAKEGKVFTLTPDGIETDLHYFQNDFRWDFRPLRGGEWVVDLINIEGSDPQSLIQAGDGYLYGTNFYQGLDGCGTAFRIATDGSGYQTLIGFPREVLNGSSFKVDVLIESGRGDLGLLSDPSTGTALFKLTGQTSLTT